MKNLKIVKQGLLDDSLKENGIKLLKDFNEIISDSDNELFDQIENANNNRDQDYSDTINYDLGYHKGWQDCLTEIVNHFTSINICDEGLNQPSKTFKSTQLEDMFRNLLK